MVCIYLCVVYSICIVIYIYVCVLLGCMCNDVQKMGSEGYIKRAIVHGVRAAIFAGAIFCQI